MAIKERLEEEERGYLKQVIPKPPGAELRGIKIVKKEIERSTEETQRNAYETGKQVAKYLENVGGKELIEKNNPKSELGRILFG